MDFHKFKTYNYFRMMQKEFLDIIDYGFKLFEDYVSLTILSIIN